MLRPRFVLPLIIPFLIVCVPTVAYILDRRAGTIPTEAEWQSAAHSSGPWMGGGVFAACFVLVVGGLILAGSGAAFAATTGRGAQPWAIQGVGIVIAAAIVFYFFGWRFE